jgi:hypothetical protein
LISSTNRSISARMLLSSLAESRVQRMIRESVQRFPEKIMRKQEIERDNSSRSWDVAAAAAKRNRRCEERPVLS